ncbi:MAG: type I 3-dehydroquinate dehydratase [Planctomycetes bacterium]|nr:type I 3-dehydroquinate dehydratase [Planctomycetota bacterium]
MAVVVSCLADSLSELLRSARHAAAHADAIELRLDRLTNLAEGELVDGIRSLGKPVIAACNGPQSYGHFRGTTTELRARLRTAARAGARFVDVDWRAADELGEFVGARRIVSRHELATATFEPRRWRDELAACARGNDLQKLVHEANSAEEALELLALLGEARGELVAFSSGAVGRFSRLLAPLLGSPFTYAAARTADGRVNATAPGQWPADELHAELARCAGGPLEFYGVVGHPIAHSLSPAVHNALLRAARRNAAYVAFEAHDFERFALAARALGVRGLSITAPFKADALRLASESDASARELGAANTWIADAHGWRASNTDVAGVAALFERAEALARRSFAGATLCVLGAGGAARAVVAVARERGLRVTVAAREPSRAVAFVSQWGAEVIPWAQIAERSWDVLFNTTPIGWRAGESPIPREWLRASVVLDALYRPDGTELLRFARDVGSIAVGGEAWFLAQAAAQFRAFSGEHADAATLARAFAKERST